MMVLSLLDMISMDPGEEPAAISCKHSGANEDCGTNTTDGNKLVGALSASAQVT